MTQQRASDNRQGKKRTLGSVGTSCGSVAATQQPRGRTRGQAHAAARSISRHVCVVESWLGWRLPDFLFTVCIRKGALFPSAKPQNHLNINWLGQAFNVRESFGACHA